MTVKGFGLTGCLGDFFGMLLAQVIGAGVDWGFHTYDVTMDAIEAGTKLPEFRKDALLIYKESKAKLKTAEEKRALRKKALDVLDRFTSIGLQHP